MQLTTLNKVISLFLVGSLVMFILGLTFAEPLYDWFRDTVPVTPSPPSQQTQRAGQDLSALVVVFLTIGFVSFAVLIGMVIDAACEFAVRKPLERKADGGGFASMPDSSGYHYWAAKLMGLKEAIDPAVRPENLDDLRSYASAVFFRNANTEHIHWTVQHYSMYILSTSLFVVVCLSSLLALHPDWNCGTRLLFLLLCAIAAWFLWCFAIGKWFYTYSVAFRNATLVLLEQREDQGSLHITLRQR